MKLLILQGLPGSGKSTLARQMVDLDPTWIIVNKDRIRAELTLTGWTWSKKNEADVIRVRDMRIQLALERGNHVVSDDCNFGKHPAHLRQLGERFGAETELYCLQTPLEECVQRDARREGSARVGEAVIRGMWCKYLAPDLSTYTFARYEHVLGTDPSRLWCVMCDLDGTLSLFDGLRSPYDAAKCADDMINLAVLDTIKALHHTYGYRIVFCSGRDSRYRTQTWEFLNRAGFTNRDIRSNPLDLPRAELYMRPAGDTRKDYIVKGELFDEHIRHRYNVRFVLDDRNQVVDFWRSIGLTVFQVAPGNF